MINGFKLIGGALIVVVLIAAAIGMKYKYCEWLAPDHIGYCVFLTK